MGERKLQTPIKLYPHQPEIEAMDEEHIHVYIEHRFTGDVVVSLYDKTKDMILMDDAWCDNEEQGQTWRAWMRCPTAEEREECAWEKALRDDDMEFKEKVKAALTMFREEKCGSCPRSHENDGCAGMIRDAKAVIEQLEERIDLMMIQMRGDCGCCQYRAEPGNSEICMDCLNKAQHGETNWVYEGLPGEAYGQAQR